MGCQQQHLQKYRFCSLICYMTLEVHFYIRPRD
jgi:hypothetical protein